MYIWLTQDFCTEYDEELQQGDGFLLIYSITDEKSLIEGMLRLF